MLFDNPLEISQLLLTLAGTRLYSFHQDRVPPDGSVLVISNHRSFMDAPVLMAAMKRPIRFACHHYMGQVPVMRDVVKRLGCFPLGAPPERNQSFFQKAVHLLQAREAVGVFPEGAEPMVKQTTPQQVGDFQRGFAHLALRAPVEDLVILPIAIAASEETTNSAVPLRLLSFFDPSEPLFAQSGWHPMVIYQRVNVMIGRPYWISSSQRQDYQGKQARSLVTEVTQACHAEINHLLTQGYY
ncbi:MAG: 1-acyl-sn-glycerol-3-phosphate acyltransferase [Oscillatoriales cyanobacterium C42_A2020_001]|nr:1-acyl-sn-glycerol-3-phosphate acyltransferase [Leptolyngbyaceae cyanobacterium C42_A2020_001]